MFYQEKELQTTQGSLKSGAKTNQYQESHQREIMHDISAIFGKLGAKHNMLSKIRVCKVGYGLKKFSVFPGD